jgi:engulfment/cell motility protein 1
MPNKRKFVENDPDFSKARYTSMEALMVFLISMIQLVLEQLSRPEERRCPLGKASNEVVELLSVHWNIFAPGC